MKKLKMKIDLSNISFDRDPNLQRINTGDSTELGNVMYEAFKDTIDYDNETREEAIQEMSETLDGKYGKIINEVSLKLLSDDEIASAIVYNVFVKENLPMITFTMTKAKFKGQGYCKKLMAESLMKLKELGYNECLLFVTEGNEPAFSIYKKLGFRVI